MANTQYQPFESQFINAGEASILSTCRSDIIRTLNHYDDPRITAGPSIKYIRIEYYTQRSVGRQYVRGMI